MSGVNVTMMMGRLCRDPELRTIPSGTPVCEFAIAVDSGWGDNKKTCFIDVTVWGKQAEFVNNKFRKGDGIFVQGRIDFSRWEDKNGGGPRSKHGLTAERIAFPTGTMTKNKSAGQPETHQGNWNNNQDIDEIPF